MTEIPSATGAAFHELLGVARAMGDDGWTRALSPDTRAALSASADALFPDELFLEALVAADDALAGGSGALATAVGRARADALVGPAAPSLGGDPFRFLKEAASLFYERRTNYGAASVELVPRKAILRLVVSEALARRLGARNRGPLLAGAFLERGVELVSGTTQAARYIGHAPRIDTRFERPMVNLMFEFDLDES
ncbi:MAG: hypothetical protein HYV09_17040 [Deltaproteobacteria bacterium]|nr:hypothetical protein [Deltaproteobacteria bacterium]